jgi:hypothetical protein
LKKDQKTREGGNISAVLSEPRPRPTVDVDPLII